VRLDGCACETLSRLSDPLKCLCRFVGFSQGVDNVEVSGVDAFAIRISIDVLGISVRGFRKSSHPQKGSGAEIQRLTAFFRAVIVLYDLIEDRIARLIILTQKIRPPDTEHCLRHAWILRIV